MQSPGHLERGKEAPPLHVGKRAILVLIALVMHFHGVYGLLATINDYVLPVALSTAVAVFSIAVMTSENTLANMLALEMDTSGESDRHPFCCGVFDYHLKYCFRFRCYARVCCNRRIYFARLLYYNMNAFLLAGAWFGLDVNRALMTEKIVGGDLTGRIWMNIVYLIFANVVLVCYHELMAQFGVVGDQAVLQFPHEPEPEVLEPDPDLSYSLGRCASVSSPVAYQSEPSPPVATHLTGGLKEVLIRSPSATKTVAKSKSFLSYFCVGRHDIISRLKIIAVFVALTMFWTATWDLFCSIPSEQMVGAETDDGDDDYYDVSVKGRSDEEFKLLFLGIAYASIAIIYMVVTGEIFAVVKRQDSHAGKLRLYFREKLACAIPFGGIYWTVCKMKLFPVRLLSHNMKGSMSVIGWAGLTMVLSSIEPNAILILTNDFGLQYGGSEHFASKHEVLAIDMTVIQGDVAKDGASEDI